MPLTVIDIERKKKWRIGLLFGLLLCMYLFMALAVYACLFIVLLPFVLARDTLRATVSEHIVVIMIGAIAVATVHFWFSASTVIRSVARTLRADPPDPEDGIHRRLLNVLDEVRIIAGRSRITALVVPSLSLNALAACDLKGEAVIAITEGLLSRLSRPQLEAVVAHEIYHIISGDCVESTLATSLFGMYASFIEQLESWSEVDRRATFHPAFLLLRGLFMLSNLLSMVVSREREYRADAAAVRMTRNPAAMAEALHLVSRNWNGSGMISNGLEMLCIVSPDPGPYDEDDSWIANLLSTHPPMRKRIRMVLNYAHSTIAAFEKTQREKDRPAAEEESPAEGGAYFALDAKQQWQGPFRASELSALPWVNPQTWLAGGERQIISRVSEIEAFNGIALMRSAGGPSAYACPSCRQSLQKVEYENTWVYQCSSCGGTLVENDKVPRIIARRERDCTARVKALARAVVQDNQWAMSRGKLRRTVNRTMRGAPCSKCRNVMFRTFYSGAYLIEIDRCSICGVTWFDVDELEMLQCLIEHKMAGTLGPVAHGPV